MSAEYCESCEEFDLLLSDLSSDLDYTSGEDRSSGSGSIVSASKLCKFTDRSKAKHQNKKRKIDVLTDSGDVVAFEAGFPRPRIVKTDIRRSYANMYVSVMNSGDFGLMFGFFDTFCNPWFSYAMTKENLIGGTDYKSFTFLRHGIAACSQFWLFHTLTVPDAAMMLRDTNVITADDDSSRIVSTFVFKATKIFDCSPVFNNPSVEPVGTKSSAHYNSELRDQVKQSIKSTVDGIVESLSLRPEPLPIESTGELTLYLDSAKRLIKIDMVARSQYTEQEYRSLMSKNRISY